MGEEKLSKEKKTAKLQSGPLARLEVYELERLSAVTAVPLVSRTIELGL